MSEPRRESEELRDLLRGAAGGTGGAVPDLEPLWRRGRRQRVGRHAAGVAAAVLVVVAVAVGAVRLTRPPVPYVDNGGADGAPAPAPSASAGSTTASATPTPTASPSGSAADGSNSGSSSSANSGGRTCLSADGTPPPDDGTNFPVFDAVQMVSATDGIVAGDGRIARTTDGGASWQTTYRGPLQLLSVQLVDATHGVALADDGQLLATDDGGGCWMPLPTPDVHLLNLHLTDPDRGWAVGVAADQTSNGTPMLPRSGGILLRTTDGGRAWTQVNGPADPQSVCATRQGPVWLTAGGGLYRSADEGTSWDEVVAPTDAYLAARVQCAGSDAWLMRFGDGATGHLAHRLDHVAADGTVTPIYAEQFMNPKVATPSPGSYPGPLSALSADQLVAIGWTPPMDPGKAVRLVVAASDGQVSDPVTVPYLYEPTAAAFRTPRDGWVTGRDANDRWVVLVTHDGGQTWQRQWDLPGRTS